MSDATIVKKIKNFATGQEMRDAIEFTYGSGMSGTTEYDAIRYLWNGKYYTLLVSAIYGVSWSSLNGANLVKGKNITIKSKKYKIRLMKCSEEDVVIDESKILTPNTEYYQFVKMRKGDIASLSNSSLLISTSYYLIMQELKNNTNNCLYCKFTSSSSTDNGTTSGNFSNSISDNDYHAVFILEELTPFIDIQTIDLGDIIGDDNSIGYTAINPSGGNVHTVIQINDNIIDSVDTPSGVRSEYIITTEQIKDLPYGKHEIAFFPSCVIDGETIIGEEKTVSFTKIKKPNPPLVDANLGKLVNQINLVSEDMDYQLFRLNQELLNIGITVSDTSSLANVVKHLQVNGGQIKKWASGTFESTYVSSSGSILGEVRGINFKPNIVIAYFLYPKNNSYLNICLGIRENTYGNPRKLQAYGYNTSSGDDGGSGNYGIREFYDDGFKFYSGNSASVFVGTYTWIAFE